MERIQHLGPYALLYQISSGGMAEIYRARIVVGTDEKDVAIKRPLPVYNEDEEFITMLIDEARITSLLDHPNLTKIYEFGVANGRHFLALEYVEGADFRRCLRRLSARGVRISTADACFVVEQALRGLGAAHSQRDTDGECLGIVHRDVTPSNILVGYDGSVKLTDFGIAKWRLTRSRTQAGFIKGKLKYMSPEQSLREPVDGRSDLFSMGCVLYLAVTGQLPFRGDSDEQILESLRHQAPTPPSHLNSELDEQFDSLLSVALAKKTTERFCSAEEMADALLAWSMSRGCRGTESELSRLTQELFASDRQEDERRRRRMMVDDDPTPMSERQSYTRLVGVDSALNILGSEDD